MEAPNCARYEGTNLRVMTNNILFHGSNHCGKRYPLLTAIYREYEPDILCLQEMDPVWYSVIPPAIRDIYDVVDTAPMGRISPVENLNPIFYRKERFKVVYKDCYTTIHQQPSEITYAVLWDKQLQKNLIVYSIHLLVDTVSKRAELQRRGSAARILDRVEKLRQKYNTDCVFIMGDFNAIESTESYQMLARDYQDSKYIATVRANTTLNTGHTIGKMPLLVEEGPRNYDYILVNKDVTEVLTHDIITTQEALNGSDHCPVYIDLILK